MTPVTAILSQFIALMWLGHTQPSAACAMLTASDIEAATGAKPGAPHPTELGPSSPGASGCLWSVRDLKGQVALSTGPLPKGVTADYMLKHNAGTDALKAAHWTETTKDFEHGACSIMTPPASRPEGLIMSSCAAEVKGTMVSVVFTSPTKKLTIEQTKGLLDKAVARHRG